MNRTYPLLLTLLLVSAPVPSLTSPGQSCTEDISLLNAVGCADACCYQDPPDSGNYVFTHTTTERIDIRNNPSGVASVSFPNLRSVEQRARISYNQAGSLTRISFPSLRSAGALEIVSNPGLVELDLPRLSTIENDEQDAYLNIRSNPALASLDVSSLDSVSATEAGNAYVQVRFNHGLADIDFPRLRSVEATEEYAEAYIFIDENNGTRSVSMDSLQRLSAGAESISYLIILDMPLLESLSFPQLRELLPTGGEDDFSELTVGHSPMLTEFAFPRLERVSVLQLSTLKGTEKAMFPSLSELGYLWIFRSCSGPDSTMKIYLCNDEPVHDVLLDNGDGLCGPSGYMLSSPDAATTAACEASPVCEPFTPAASECNCGAVGQCVP